MCRVRFEEAVCCPRMITYRPSVPHFHSKDCWAQSPKPSCLSSSILFLLIGSWLSRVDTVILLKDNILGVKLPYPLKHRPIKAEITDNKTWSKRDRSSNDARSQNTFSRHLGGPAQTIFDATVFVPDVHYWT